MTEQEDASNPTLLQRARKGDTRALDAIVRAEIPRVVGLLRRILGPRPDLDDLVQTVFLEMCQALPRFRGDSALSTFVGGITIRVARRAMRRSAWVRFRGSMPLEAASDRKSQEDGAHATEQLRRATAAIERIAPKKRIAFTLWALEGMEVPAIAEMMGATVASTRSRILYAQRELKRRAAADPYLRDLLGGEP